MILCSAERAEALGVPARPLGVPAQRHRRARPLLRRASATTSAAPPPCASPDAAALELAGVGVDDLAHVDLYSCFPSAVEIAAYELGHRHSTGRSRSPAACRSPAGRGTTT